MAVKRYDGSAWQTVAGLGAQGAAATSSSIATWVKTASGGETSLSGNDDNSQSLSYTVGQELVFINGTLLKRGSDYTATNGTSITGLTALAANDVATVWTVNAFSVTGAIANTIVDAKGDLLVGTAADTPGRLAVGTDGQVLTAASTTGTGLTWTTPSSNGWTQISSQSLTGSSISFSSISGTYQQLVIVIQDWVLVDDGRQILMRFNSDTGNNYYQYIFTNSNGTQSDALTNPNSAIYTTLYDVDNSDFNNFCVFTITNYANTNSVKIATGNAWYKRNSTAAYGLDGNIQAWNSTSAITSITLVPQTGNFSQGTAILYGVK